MTHNMLVPLPFRGSVFEFNKRTDLHKGYDWLTHINSKDIYLVLFECWPSHTGRSLPANYKVYIVSFHLEAVDIEWLKEQSKQIKGEIIVLFDGNSNNYTIPRVRFMSYYYWHIQLNTMLKWFTNKSSKKISHKASAFCNRITETKLITFTALAENIGTDECMLVLHDWLEKKNIQNENKYFPTILKQLHDIFFSKYYGKKYTIDEFNNTLNNQKYTANPWQPAYQNCAIHFTNESFNISDIQDIALYSHPGPFLTEKTLKCLLGKTAFIPVGQFDTYGTLERLGFKFEYDLDLSFDRERYDNNRLLGIVELIKQISLLSKEEIYIRTKESSEYNFDYIVSGAFYKHCEELNQHTVKQVLEHIDLVTN